MISVIVPVYNESQHLDKVIRALLEQHYAPDQRELIFVDNGSTDTSLEILRSYPGLKVFSETERGSYAARNLGITQAKGDILAFTDSDCYPALNWLSAIEAAFSGGRADIVMGPRLPTTPSPALDLISEYENKKAELIFRSRDPLVYFGYTNNMAMRKGVMDRFGPFECRTRGSDTIFIRRVVNELSCEAVTFCENMTVKHAEMGSVSSYYKKIRIYSRSQQAYRHIMKVRPLNLKERLDVFYHIARKRKLKDSIKLLALLIGGAVVWWWGGIMVSKTDS